MCGDFFYVLDFGYQGLFRVNKLRKLNVNQNLAKNAKVTNIDTKLVDGKRDVKKVKQ